MTLKEFTSLLYQSAQVFYPIYFMDQNEAFAQPVINAWNSSWGIVTRPWFREKIFTFTNTDDLGQAINILSKWVALSEEQLSQTVPENIKTLVDSYKEELEKNKNQPTTNLKTATKTITQPNLPEPETVITEPTYQTPQTYFMVVTPLKRSLNKSLSKTTATIPNSLARLGIKSVSQDKNFLPEHTTALDLLADGVQPEDLLKMAESDDCPKNLKVPLQKTANNLQQLIRNYPSWSTLAKRAASISSISLQLSKPTSTQSSIVKEMHLTSSGTLIYPRTSFVGGFISNLGTKILGRSVSRFLGLEKVASSLVGGTTAATIATTATVTGETATAVGSTTAAVAAGTAVAPGPGTLAALAISLFGKEAIKKAGDFLSKNSKVLAAAPLFLIAGIGAMIGSVPMIVGGGVAGGLVLSGSPKKLFSTTGHFLGSVVSGITTLFVASIGTPILVTLIAFPLIVGFILLVINSGAFIAPRHTPVYESWSESAFMQVKKIPDQSGPFTNSDLPKKITYTVEITARKGTLTNIKITDVCHVTKEGTAPSCPEADGFKSSLAEVPASQKVSFSYSRTYTSSFTDSLIADVVTVTADAPGETGTQANASAGIKFGTPPDECPNGWPVQGVFEITQGPHAGSHAPSLEAIDIGTPVGTNVFATHTGIAQVVYTSNAYRPAYVDITSVCGGVTFYSRYAHLSAVFVTSGQTVTMGQSIGLSGSDGTGPHLHYHFNNLKMSSPYIPKPVKYGCPGGCGWLP